MCFIHICVSVHCVCVCVCSDLVKLHLVVHMPHIPIRLGGLCHDLDEVQSSPQLKAHMWAVTERKKKPPTHNVFTTCLSKRHF